jgi:hypothetical protein
MATDMWTYRDEVKRGKAGLASDVDELDLSGYSVETRDGEAGKVDQAAYEDGRSFLVVDTGPPLLGKKVLVPAALVRKVDQVAQSLELEVTKDTLESAPEVDEERLGDETYMAEVGPHYGGSAA